MDSGAIDRLPTKSLDEVLERIGSVISPLGPEELAADDALHRVLAQDVLATVEFPAFDRAGIDGLALRADETVGASPYNPLAFRRSDRTDELAPGAAAQVSAGDRLPAGADAVVPPEFFQAGMAGVVEVIDTVPPEHEVERKASHFSAGTVLLRAGRCLRPPDLGLLGAGGVDRVAVVRRPRIVILSRAGASITADGGAPGDLAMLQALVERDGGCVIGMHRVDRAQAAIQKSIADVDADVVLLEGGPERGRDRGAVAAFADAGRLDIAEIALNPGGSVALGRTAKGAWAFSLPAGLVSSFCAYEAVIGRAIRRLSGRSLAWPYQQREMTLARKIVSTIGITEFCTIRCSADGVAEPLSGYARANPRWITEADGFVVIPEGSEGMSTGSAVQVYLFDGSSDPTKPDMRKDVS
jgi:molybdopterin molybdotransferase